jgi:hypothetical protein
VYGRDLSQVMSGYSIISNARGAQFTERSDRIVVARSVIPVPGNSVMAGDLVFRMMLRMEINKRATWPLAVQLITCRAGIDYSYNIDIG